MGLVVGSTYGVLGELAEDNEIDVFERLPAEQGPFLVRLILQVVTPIQRLSKLEFSYCLLRIPFLFHTPAARPVLLELLNVHPQVNLGVGEIASLQKENMREALLVAKKPANRLSQTIHGYLQVVAC